MLVNIDNVEKVFNGEPIISGVSFTIENEDRIGLVGVNGCGKSTLLNIITGGEFCDEGTVSVTNGCSIGYLRQNAGLERTNTIIEEMRQAFGSLLTVAEDMRKLEQMMSDPKIHDDEEHFKRVSEEYSRKTTYFEANEGYLIEVKIRTVLNGMGFPKETYDRVINTLSGGERTRLAIAKLLLENPSLLILDEPTNHLDFKTVMWLEDYLSTYKGALLLVSHDRYFLDKLATSICEIERGKLTRYKGNYTKFVKLKEEAVALQMKRYEEQQAEIAKLQDYVDRNLVRASTTKAAQSRRNQLEKMELIEKPVTYHKTARLKFEYDIIPPKDVLTVTGIDISVGEKGDRKRLAENVSFEVKRGDKLGVIGANGTGKSTLLKIVQSKLPHERGRIEWTKNIKISYFDQEAAGLNPEKTVFDELHDRYPAMSDLEVRNALGKVRLTGENVFKKIGVISGGERAKLCFAIMMLERGNVLILDEPTNHLDLASKEVLEAALEEYDGTVIFVSHDRYLLSRIATGLIEITDKDAECYNCGFEGYMDICRERAAEAERLEEAEKQRKAKELAAEKSVKAYRSKEQRSADAKRKNRIRELEKSIDECQRQIDILTAELSSPEVTADYRLMNEKCALIEELKNKMNEQTDEWLLLSEE